MNMKRENFCSDSAINSSENLSHKDTFSASIKKKPHFLLYLVVQKTSTEQGKRISISPNQCNFTNHCKAKRQSARVHRHKVSQRLALATRSISSFFLMAYEFEEPLEALMISSAKHSGNVLMVLKEASRAPVVIR